ncbi:MAG: SelT/SelW/SelH family protein [Halofilum sp. (in: g-proteobacteria)]
MNSRPRIVIAYCPRCGWLLRAAWLAQELLSTFGADLGEVALAPGGKGVFDITTGDGQRLWSRADEGRFPEPKELKKRVRDALFPGRDLGHSDR